jgi:hypothetical protein
MIEAKIRLAADRDGAHLLKAVADEQDYQLPEHSRRPPKCDRADRRRDKITLGQVGATSRSD